MKKITTSIITTIALSILIGCGGGDSSTSEHTSSATISDSNIAGLDYITNSGISGVTDSSGKFVFKVADSSVTFKLGELTIGTFNLHNLKSDKTVLVGELFGLDRNNNTDPRLLKTIRLLQSLDNDNNPNNGIQISDAVKDKISDLIDTNTSINKNLIDNDIDTIKFIVTNQHKNFILEKDARKHYEKTLLAKGIQPKIKQLPFTFVCRVGGFQDKNITIDTLPQYKYLWNNEDYNYTVDWGDGTIDKDLNDTKTHVYKRYSLVTIKITGKFPHFYLGSDDLEQIEEISQWGDIKWKSFISSFAKTPKLKITATDTPDLSECKSLRAMFHNSNFTSNSTINDWNTSNITDMHDTFAGAINFNQPLDKWDTSNVTDMSSMFYNAKSFNQNINSWNVSNVTNMKYMFYQATNFNQPLDKWDTSNVTTMLGMFNEASSFNQNIDTWNVSKVTNMYQMFSNATAFNQPLNDWNVSNVKDMSYMFNYATSFNQPLNKWDTSSVTKMNGMFYSAKSFSQDLSMWNVDNVSSHNLFSNGAGNLTEPNWK